MSHYSDAEDSPSMDLFKDMPGHSGMMDGAKLRRRKGWDSEAESIASEIKELLDEDVNSLVSELVEQKAGPRFNFLIL